MVKYSNDKIIMAKKEKIKIKHWDYYGEVKNGKPHSKGQLKGKGLYPIEINKFDKELNNKMY